jgi:hypothetical protein
VIRRKSRGELGKQPIGQWGKSKERSGCVEFQGGQLMDLDDHD